MTRVCVILLTLSFLFVAATADAQSSRRDDGGSARLQALVSQLTAEKAQLQQENTRLTRELGELEKELEAEQERANTNEDKLRSAESEASRFRRSTDQAKDVLEQTRSRLDELVERFRETVGVLRTTEQERADLTTELSDMTLNYTTCANHNMELYTTGLEVLAAFEGQGPMARAGKREPFTQLVRVRIENIADEYRYALEDNLLPENTVSQQ